MKIRTAGWITLAISGMVALLALAAPTLVVLGYFLFIIPGLILTIAPTLFVYLAATFGVREFLPIPSRFVGTIVSFCIVLTISWLVMQPFRARELAKYRAEIKEEIVPAQPLKLNGHVRIEIENYFHEPECDYLCAGLLGDPDVKSVTVSSRRDNEQDERTFAIVPANLHPEPGLYPVDPGRLIREINLGQKYEQQRQTIKSLEAAWALRLAGEERLIARAPISVEKADWTIRRSRNKRQKHGVRSQRVEVIDSTGQVRYRDSQVSHKIPSNIFYFGFHAEMGAGTLTEASFSVGGQTLFDGVTYFESEKSLLKGIQLQLPPLPDSLTNQLQSNVAKALDKPGASQPRLELAKHWLSSFMYDVQEDDIRLIEKILVDPRINDLKDAFGSVFHQGKVPHHLNVPIAQRIAMNASSQKERYFFAKMLADAPAGTFAEPHKAYQDIWINTDICRHALPFVKRITDLEPQRAAAVLLRSLESSFDLASKAERKRLIEAIQDCFVELGPEASMAIPQLRRYFHGCPEMFFGRTGSERWRFVFARMGVAIDDLPLRSFENKLPSSWLTNMRTRLQQRLDRYEKKHSSKVAVF